MKSFINKFLNELSLIMNEDKIKIYPVVGYPRGGWELNTPDEYLVEIIIGGQRKYFVRDFFTNKFFRISRRQALRAIREYDVEMAKFKRYEVL